MRWNWYHFPWFEDWLDGTGSIPDIYWNVYSEEQRYKFLCCRLQKLVEYAQKIGMQLNLQGDAINELADELSRFYDEFADEFEEYYKTRICEWLNAHLACVISNAIMFVQFGLTDDGRIAMHVPNNWDFLRFSMSPIVGDDYGKLAIDY